MSRLTELIEAHRSDLAVFRGRPDGTRSERELHLLEEIELARERQEQERERVAEEKRRERARSQQQIWHDRIERLAEAFAAVMGRPWHSCWLDPIPPDALNGARQWDGPTPTITIGGVPLGVGGLGDCLRIYDRCETCGLAGAWETCSVLAHNLVALGVLLERPEARRVPTKCGGCRRQEMLSSERIEAAAAEMEANGAWYEEQARREDVNG